MTFSKKYSYKVQYLPSPSPSVSSRKQVDQLTAVLYIVQRALGRIMNKPFSTKSAIKGYYKVKGEILGAECNWFIDI